VLRGKYDDPEDEGDLSHFQALCAALSATIGLGNIAGVAVAISTGGPGALFWMWVCAFFGMATKFTTCTLATKYRTIDERGHAHGGPMYSIEMGLGKAWKPLAVAFAACGVMASFGGGNMFQSNQVAGNLERYFLLSPKVTGVALAILVAVVIIGGIRRIGQVAGRLVPFMCVIYVLGALYVMLTHIADLPQVFAMIFHHAFAGTAAAGGFMGAATKLVIVQGVRRATFSNEAGLGSAPIAHAAARTKEHVREGLVAMLGPFIDTIVICSMTATVIIITGTWRNDAIGRVVRTDTDQAVLTLEDTKDIVPGDRLLLKRVMEGRPETTATFTVKELSDGAVSGAAKPEKSLQPQPGDTVHRAVQGATLASHAFDRAIPGFGKYIVSMGVLLFAFSTMISWSYYGERCTEYVLGAKAITPYRYLYVIAILVGALFKLQPVLDFSDITFALMVIPNLIATLALVPVVLRDTRDYFSRMQSE